MCEAGRIKHHLKHNLWRPENTILFVGYQAVNTLGRSLLNGARKVKLFGESVHVAAEIKQLPGISGHADLNGLMNWIKAIEKPKKVFINHGDHEATEALSQKLRDELNLDTYCPYSGSEFDMLTGQVTYDAEPVLIPREKRNPNANAAYNELLNASDKLYRLIKDNSGRANADMRKLTEAIHKLCEEWVL